MKKLIILSSLFLLNTFISIQLVAQKTIRYSETNFENTFHLKSEQVKPNDFKPAASILHVDSLLILMKIDGPVFFDVVSIKTGRIIATFGKKGDQPGEFFGPFSIYYEEKTKELVAYDLGLKNVLFYSLPKIVEKKEDGFIKQIHIDDCHPVRIYPGKNSYMAALMGTKDGDCFAELDASGKVRTYFGKYPEIIVNYNKLLGHSLFSIYAGVNSEYSINSYHFWDRIEIYKDKELTNTLEGPNYDEFHVAKNKDHAIKTSENNYAFGRPILGKDYFIVAYSGKNYYENNGAEHLFKIGYDGKLISNYVLDVPIIDYSIDVDWKTGEAYALTDGKNQRIVRFKLK
ncbi:MAG: hypothetical protein ACERKD_04475 [Prolixibacteraceae bacterium]